MGVISGVFGFLVSNVLTYEGEALAWLPKLVAFVTGAKNRSVAKYNSFQYWAYKISHACAKCVAGNAALWISIAKVFSYGLNTIFCHFSQGFVTVTLAIFSDYLIEKYV